MSKLNLETKTTRLGVTVQESDEYTNLIHVKFEKHVLPEDIISNYSLYLTQHEFETISKFFAEQANAFEGENE